MTRWGINWNKVSYACFFAMGMGVERANPFTGNNSTTSGWFLFSVGLIGFLIAGYYVKQEKAE